MKILAAIFLACMVPIAAHAHGLGTSLEKTVGNYWIDIGYDPAQAMGGDRMVFDFNLAEATATSTSVDYEYVWVRLHANDRTLLATGVHRAEIGATTLLISLPKETEGRMGISVRFQGEEGTIAEASFEIPVVPYEDPRWWWPFAGAGGVGLLFGAFSFAVWQWKTRRRTDDTL